MPYCNACGADVIWRESLNGMQIVLNPEPQPLGMLYIGEDDKARPWLVTISRGVPRYESHTYTCPNAGELEEVR